MLSVHTSPLHQPGTGDAGGMNVYIVELAKRLAVLGIEVEGWWSAQACVTPWVKTHSWAGHYDLVHSHYWLSGHVGRLAAERWGVPLVHAMHTMAKVKNAGLADGDTPEPAARVLGETQVVRAADRLTANTGKEAEDLLRHYDADPGRVAVVHPGVDLERFRSDARGVEAGRAVARSRPGLPQDALIPLFVGRIQPLKAPDVLLRAVARLLAERPRLRERIVVPVVGGPSGSGLAEPEGLQKLAARLGIGDVVLFRPPVGQDRLADWYRAASVLVMPSHSESFGLVAVEAQACGTPVIAAQVGGLPVAVRDGVSGVLVPGHDPADYARALYGFADTPARSARMGEAAIRHARSFGWASAADVYTAALLRRGSGSGVLHEGRLR
ncbi:glycosyltransferase [Streptomyces cyaneochromogenes]|uniref:D-inositol 3-phosphate glycosyltransferase n=2 Tax=Streptomyces cyaneochromogenes TaxID=2496836 RepID=A0A3Q9F0Z4_9ACTN|nr:glycosyltransferase [Streptomyces cyaneochromogenes]